MNLKIVLSIFCGAGFGALSRWGLGLALNSVAFPITLGTLTANLIGGLLIGISYALFDVFQNIPNEIKLGITTGFLGGLTTFSTFSAEVVNLLLTDRYGIAIATVLTHVSGSLIMTYLGIKLVSFIAN